MAATNEERAATAAKRAAKRAKGARDAEQVPTVPLVRAEAFQLIDASGKVIAELSMFGGGGPCLSVRGRDGLEEIRVMAGGSSDSDPSSPGFPQILLFDNRDGAERTARIHIGCTVSGPGALMSFCDRDGAARLQIAVGHRDQDRVRVSFFDHVGRNLGCWQPERAPEPIPEPEPIEAPESPELSDDTTATLMDLAHRGEEAEFRWLAQSQGVLESDLDALWRGTVARLRRRARRRQLVAAETEQNRVLAGGRA